MIHSTMFVLVDCNNFYVSCERVFNPSLNNKPVVVLSNNDGCIVARSNEVKNAGVKMGQPLFKVREDLEKLGCYIFSSNYSLYGDMSARVMEVLSYYTPNIEIYSIDEVFLEIPDYPEYQLVDLGLEIKERVMKYVGLPVCVGFGPTKTLAKLANQMAKKDSRKDNIYGGVYAITDEINATPAKQLDVEDIWGIGFQYGKYLRSMKVNTVEDFCELDHQFVKSKFTIQGLTTQNELNFKKCLELEMFPDHQKNLISSRSFGTAVTDKNGIREAVANHVANATRKLRKKGLATSILKVFIMTDRFKEEKFFYSASLVLDMPTNNTVEILKKAMLIVDHIFVPNRLYKKAGVILFDLVESDNIQPSFFDEPQSPKITSLLKAVDHINSIMGKNKVKLLTQGVVKKGPSDWMLRSQYRSNRFSTRWDEMLVVKDQKNNGYTKPLTP
ncbi:MAG: Y-family DNA polymerase [Patescibacteria group bacterium]